MKDWYLGGLTCPALFPSPQSARPVLRKVTVSSSPAREASLWRTAMTHLCFQLDFSILPGGLIIWALGAWTWAPQFQLPLSCLCAGPVLWGWFWWKWKISKHYIYIYLCFCGVWDLVPWPRIEPVPPPLKVQSLNQWTIREVLQQHHINARQVGPGKGNGQEGWSAKKLRQGKGGCGRRTKQHRGWPSILLSNGWEKNAKKRNCGGRSSPVFFYLLSSFSFSPLLPFLKRCALPKTYLSPRLCSPSPPIYTRALLFSVTTCCCRIPSVLAFPPPAHDHWVWRHAFTLMLSFLPSQKLASAVQFSHAPSPHFLFAQLKVAWLLSPITPFNLLWWPYRCPCHQTKCTVFKPLFHLMSPSVWLLITSSVSLGSPLCENHWHLCRWSLGGLSLPFLSLLTPLHFAASLWF